MRTISTTKIFGSLFLLSLSSLALAVDGGYSGGGGDQIQNPFNSYAWFGDNARAVNVCAEIDPQFGPSANEPVKGLKAALKTWSDYLDAKGLNKDFPLPKLGFATDYRVTTACQGNEDLTVYFGSENEKIAKARMQHVAPVGLAIQESFEAQKAWGKGFIWIARSQEKGAAQWNRGGNLRAILLHEIGHTLGINHVEGTIMTEHIQDLIHSQMNTTRKYTIDHQRNLFMSRYDDFSDLNYEIGTSIPAFYQLSRFAGFSDQDIAGYKITALSDQEITIEARVKNGETFVSKTLKFKSTRMEEVAGEWIFSHKWAGWKQSEGQIRYGQITNELGQKLPMVVSVNLPATGNQGLVRMTLVKDGEFLDVGYFRRLAFIVFDDQ